MSQNQSIEIAKSAPCIETPPPILSHIEINVSDHSMSSYKSCYTDEGQEIDKPIEKRPSVRALIDKHKLFQEKLFNAKVTKFNINKKTFKTACENLHNSSNDRIHMEGDPKRMDNVNNFVKNHIYEIFTVNKLQEDFKPSSNINQIQDLEKKSFSFKTDMTELDKVVNNMDQYFWDNIISLVNANHIYYDCLTQIMDAQKFQHLEDVIDHISLTLNKVEGSELIGSKIIASYSENVRNIGNLVDSKLNDKLTKYPLLNSSTKLKNLRNELEETKRNLKIVENKTILLQKEKRDLLNILDSYTHENIHKVSLKKQLKAEQENSDKLKKMIASIFKKKIIIYNSDEEEL